MIPLIERHPKPNEVERIRLLLSTFQDGGGMLKHKGGTLPGWRDFERVIAATFSGHTLETKSVYDVIINSSADDLCYGISCKMRGTLAEVERKGRVTMELSNASGEFWTQIKQHEIAQENYHLFPEIVGSILLAVVGKWHTEIKNNGKKIDPVLSCFLTLQWDEKNGLYQLFQFPIHLPSASDISWKVKGRKLVGYDRSGILFEWYGFSGGQLKYYPSVTQAIWNSATFFLEPLPPTIDFTLQSKAKVYFPTAWEKSQEGNE